MWNYEGLSIEATYLGEFEVKGKVRLSRVKYGGGVSHHIELEEPITVYGEFRDSLIIDHEDVVRVYG